MYMLVTWYRSGYDVVVGMNNKLSEVKSVRDAGVRDPRAVPRRSEEKERRRLRSPDPGKQEMKH